MMGRDRNTVLTVTRLNYRPFLDLADPQDTDLGLIDDCKAVEVSLCAQGSRS